MIENYALANVSGRLRNWSSHHVIVFFYSVTIRYNGSVSFEKRGLTMSLKLLLVQLASIVSIVIAGILAYDGTQGWGWFLFVAVLMSAPNAIEQIASSKEKAVA
jgi:hypothetical protein